jgi:hypothetical protein
MSLSSHEHDPEPYLLVMPDGSYTWSRYRTAEVPGRSTVLRPRFEYCQDQEHYSAARLDIAASIL